MCEKASYHIDRRSHKLIRDRSIASLVTTTAPEGGRKDELHNVHAAVLYACLSDPVLLALTTTLSLLLVDDHTAT